MQCQTYSGKAYNILWHLMIAAASDDNCSNGIAASKFISSHKQLSSPLRWLYHPRGNCQSAGQASGKITGDPRKRKVLFVPISDWMILISQQRQVSGMQVVLLHPLFISLLCLWRFPFQIYLFFLSRQLSLQLAPNRLNSFLSHAACSSCSFLMTKPTSKAFSLSHMPAKLTPSHTLPTQFSSPSRAWKPLFRQTASSPDPQDPCISTSPAESETVGKVGNCWARNFTQRKQSHNLELALCFTGSSPPPCFIQQRKCAESTESRPAACWKWLCTKWKLSAQQTVRADRLAQHSQSVPTKASQALFNSSSSHGAEPWVLCSSY